LPQRLRACNLAIYPFSAELLWADQSGRKIAIGIRAALWEGPYDLTIRYECSS
jgi:hypothetical protein